MADSVYLDWAVGICVTGQRNDGFPELTGENVCVFFSFDCSLSLEMFFCGLSNCLD